MIKNYPHIEKSYKPFLRWAGGKNWLLKDLHTYLPNEGFNNYVEPFLGGGSVFFHLSPKEAILSDVNSELVETYCMLRDYVDSIIEILLTYSNTESFYYQIRSKIPNNEIERAARFIYLNQTSFNGIYRVNLKGEYNVPYGFRVKKFLQEDNLRAASECLKSSIIKTRDFYSSLEDVRKGDLVFLDPPYTVTHNNNGFIKYNAKLFDLKAQLMLSKFIDCVHEIGANYILTNAAHEEIRNIFKRQHNNIKTTSRASLVGGNNAKRGKYEEFIITNTN